MCKERQMEKHQFEQMLHLAVSVHSGTCDRGGTPYIFHVLHVLDEIRKKYPDDYELMAIAVGHDVIEDSSVTAEEMLEIGFSERVVNGILCLTKDRTLSEEYYQAKVLSNLDAIKVKIEDIRHNSDITRLKGLREKDFERMVKYHRFFVSLNNVLLEIE